MSSLPSKDNIMDIHWRGMLVLLPISLDISHWYHLTYCEVSCNILSNISLLISSKQRILGVRYINCIIN